MYDSVWLYVIKHWYIHLSTNVVTLLLLRIINFSGYIYCNLGNSNSVLKLFLLIQAIMTAPTS